MKQDRPLSYSSLKAFNTSPNHLLNYWAKVFTPTPAMAKGSLIHTLILEPEEFESRYAVWDGGRRAGKEYKAFQESNEGKDILKAEEVEEVTKIVDSVKNNVLLNKMTGTELLVEWDLNGQPFKGFVDGFGDGFILDVKTTSDASPKAFLRDVIKYKYYWQAALYLNANEELNFAGEKPDFFILAVETSAPFNTQMYKLKYDLIETSRSYSGNREL
jgi:hypothetical protein